jgi:hypothetical protein
MPEEYSFAKRLLNETPRTESEESPEEHEGEAALTSRSVGQLPTLQLRFKDGRASAVPYPYMLWADYDPAIGITLEFATRHVLILGQGLDQVFAQIAAHKRVVVEALSAPAKMLPGNGGKALISRIDLQKIEDLEEAKEEMRLDNRNVKKLAR